MSQPQSPHHARPEIDVEKQIDTDDQLNPPQSALDRNTQGPSHSSDTSIPLFTLYLRTAEDYDWRRLKLLKGDTDQILVFCGLFSATVAALIVPSISDLTTTSSVQQFTSLSLNPSAATILSNSFWLLSLLISVSCALAALSLLRWAQPRTRVNSPGYSLPEEARLRMFFAAGIDRVNFASLVKTLHCLVHFAFSLFLVGSLLYFFTVNSIIFFAAVLCTVLVFMIYVYLTVIPIFQPGSPYSTPFSDIVAIASAGVLHGTSRLLYSVKSRIRVSRATQGVDRHPKDRFRGWYLGLMKLAQEKVQELTPQIDGDVLKRTLDIVRSDDDLEELFEAIPGFCVSKIVDSRRSLDIVAQKKLAEALVQFWNRTLSSNRVSEYVKGRRLIVCIRVIEAADLSIAIPRILHLFSTDLAGVSRSVEIGHSLKNLRNGKAASLTRGVIASIISINDERDERWFTLAMDELGISEDVLRRYLERGDSVLLANLIHIARQFFDSLDSDLTRSSLRILPSLSKFDILKTLPELQHDFCSLWNKIVQQARSGDDNNPFVDILRVVEIQRLCIALHRTDPTFTYFFASSAGRDDLLRQPALYPLCTLPDHRTQEAGCITTGGASHSTATTPIPFSESPVGDFPDTQHFPTLDPSIAQPIAQPDEGITAEPASSTQSNPQVTTIAGPRKRRTFSSGFATHRANGNAHPII